jgi:effector-binding domain-containing protein
MSKLQSVVLLTHSLSLAEKKAFRIRSSRNKTNTDYLILYDVIDKNRELPTASLLAEFLKARPGASVETTVKYLFELLLDTMLELKKEQDSFYFLFNKILKAKILYEKSLFDECFGLLDDIIEQAEKYENYYALLLASRLDLDYLLALNFPNLNEKTLLKKQFRLNEALKYVRKINEQSSLYENLKHRIVYKGYARSQKQKDELNDLVYSEISIVASQNVDNFEISKLHQLFQSNYLISVGDYQSALNSYIELNNLFEANKHLWSNPPVYYLHTLEGVLESLRSIHNYNGMTYFINQLKAIDNPSAGFRINLTCIIYLYELFPLLDRGDFAASMSLMYEYKVALFDKLFTLNRARQAELCLYTALIYFGNSEYHNARKFLNQIILRGKNYYYLPVYRTVRLVNLMILYKMGDFELIKYEIRSMKRDLMDTTKDYRIERFLLKFLSKPLSAMGLKRQQLLEKTEREFEEIRNDVFEKQILRIFDFTAWVESLLRKTTLSEVLHNRSNTHNTHNIRA